MKNNRPAFTLIEVLVVIAIIGLLVVVSVTSFNNAREKSRDTQRASDVKLIQLALEKYYRDEGKYPDSLTSGQPLMGSISSTTYMTAVPIPPTQADGTCSTTGYIYTPLPDIKSYNLSFCLGGITGSLSAGRKCANPSGVQDTDCGGSFSCGQNINYGGETYPTVQMGSQCWMARNLDIGTQIGNGSSVNGADGLASTTDDCVNVYPSLAFWSCQGAAGIQKYCYNDSASICATDGGLYEWAEAVGLPYYCNITDYTCSGATCTSALYPSTCSYPNPSVTPRQGICPPGWHLPSYNDMSTNPNFSNASLLKATASNVPVAWDGGNSSGFTALPAGMRWRGGSFQDRGSKAYYFLSLPTNLWASKFFGLASYPGGTMRGESQRVNGLSIRCLKN